jgi:hypothetical protein
MKVKSSLNNWTMDKYYEISTTSKGVGNLTLNYTMRSTKDCSRRI